MVNWARMESKLLVFVLIFYVLPQIGAKHYLVELPNRSLAQEVDKEEGKREDHQYAKDHEHVTMNRNHDHVNGEEHSRVKDHGQRKDHGHKVNHGHRKDHGHGKDHGQKNGHRMKHRKRKDHAVATAVTSAVYKRLQNIDSLC